MRLWDISMLPYLPREQLVSQWRECSAIASAIQKNGTPNHILVNFVTEYPYDHFISYCFYLREEMTSRGYRTMDSVWRKIIALKPNYVILHQTEIYPSKFSYMYKKICYYNLLEKYIRGGITPTDWGRINAWAMEEKCNESN